MKPVFFLLAASVCMSAPSLHAQNVGIGETAPIAKIEVRSDGIDNATNALLIKNNTNFPLFRVQSGGSSTFGILSLSNPPYIVGIYNGTNLAKAHIGLYATGALPGDAGSTNRIGFSNTSNGFQQFEIQSYSGTSAAARSLSFKFFNFSGTPTETNLLNLSADGQATFSGNVSAPQLSTASLTLTTPGGNPSDFLIESASSGTVGYKKGTGALGMNYIICVQGAFPTFGAGTASNSTLLGEVRLWAGVTPPTGWEFCQGQVLPIAGNTGLFSLLGTIYGGNGSTTFALPDLRGAVPVQQGTPPSGRAWSQGERSF